MSLFQILMLGATLFFAYQIYRHVQELDDSAPLGGAESGTSPRPTLSPSALVDQADRAYEEGNIDQAKKYLEEAYALDETDVEILNKLAFVTARSGDRIRAIELYERSLEIDENDDLTHNAIASLYRAEGAFDRAKDHYLTALEIDDSYAQTYYNYANLLADRHEIDEAKAMYARALELQSDFPQARDALESLERGE